jgi:hypothetical protein
MAKQFECERDGVVIRGADDDEQWRRWSATLPGSPRAGREGLPRGHRRGGEGGVR